MSDPYETMGLSPGASDADIRRRYLELVRRYPPEHHPERFAAIREAYDQLRDPEKRLETKLFGLKADESLDAILADVSSGLRAGRISTSTLLSLAERQ